MIRGMKATLLALLWVGLSTCPSVVAKKDRKRPNTAWDGPIRVRHNQICVVPELALISCVARYEDNFVVYDPTFRQWANTDVVRHMPSPRLPTPPSIVATRVLAAAVVVVVDERMPLVFRIPSLLFVSFVVVVRLVVLACVVVWLVVWRCVPPWWATLACRPWRFGPRL